MSKARMLYAVLQQIRAGKVMHSDEKNFHKKDVLYFQTDKLIIDNPSLAPLHIDGEPAITSLNFTIKILPAAFRLVRP
jgi:diacylglycerol kinase family enzyme